jgi:ribonuclease III
MKPRDIEQLEEKLDHRFARRELLEQALTHSSWAREREQDRGSSDAAEKERGDSNERAIGVDDNEQMEFMGDAVLGFVTSAELFRRFPAFREGQLSKIRAHLVSEEHLIRAAKKLHLGKYLRLGRGEDKSGGRDKPAILADALEAVLAAIYLDAGLEKARGFILERIVEPELRKLKKQIAHGLPIKDYKSALQEAAHMASRPQPAYVLVKEEGPQHRKTFTVEVRLHRQGDHRHSDFAGRGEGTTKKKAEQDAARAALEYLWSLRGDSGAGGIPNEGETRVGAKRSGSPASAKPRSVNPTGPVVEVKRRSAGHKSALIKK